MLLEDILKEFVYECEVRSYSERTIKSYKNNNKLFHTFLKKEFEIIELEKVQAIHIKKYISYLQKKKLTQSYANGIIKTFRAFFKYCMKEEYLEKNPILKVEWQKEPKTLIKTFTDEEVIGLLNAFNSRDYLNLRNKVIIATLIDTGIRCNELCTIENVDVSGNRILIRGKGNKERYVGISPLLQKLMMKYVRIKEQYFKNKYNLPNNYFLSRNGLMLTIEAIERFVKEAGKIARVREEIRCSPHTIRHYASQRQLKNGLGIYELSRLLGHENTIITRRYLQSMEDGDIVEMSIKTSPLMNLKL